MSALDDFASAGFGQGHPRFSQRLDLKSAPRCCGAASRTKRQCRRAGLIPVDGKVYCNFHAPAARRAADVAAFVRREIEDSGKAPGYTRIRNALAIALRNDAVRAVALLIQEGVLTRKPDGSLALVEPGQ